MNRMWFAFRKSSEERHVWCFIVPRSATKFPRQRWTLIFCTTKLRSKLDSWLPTTIPNHHFLPNTTSCLPSTLCCCCLRLIVETVDVVASLLRITLLASIASHCLQCYDSRKRTIASCVYFDRSCRIVYTVLGWVELFLNSYKPHDISTR